MYQTFSNFLQNDEKGSSTSIHESLSRYFDKIKKTGENAGSNSDRTDVTLISNLYKQKFGGAEFSDLSKCLEPFRKVTQQRPHNVSEALSKMMSLGGDHVIASVFLLDSCGLFKHVGGDPKDKEGDDLIAFLQTKTIAILNMVKLDRKSVV